MSWGNITDSDRIGLPVPEPAVAARIMEDLDMVHETFKDYAAMLGFDVIGDGMPWPRPEEQLKLGAEMKARALDRGNSPSPFSCSEQCVCRTGGLELLELAWRPRLV